MKHLLAGGTAAKVELKDRCRKHPISHTLKKVEENGLERGNVCGTSPLMGY